MLNRDDRSETIVAAALYIGYTVSMPPPARHHTLLNAIVNSIEMYGPEQQGFLTSRGRYVSREEAKDIAFRSGQCKNPEHHTQLFSEDLW